MEEKFCHDVLLLFAPGSARCHKSTWHFMRHHASLYFCLAAVAAGVAVSVERRLMPREEVIL